MKPANEVPSAEVPGCPHKPRAHICHECYTSALATQRQGFERERDELASLFGKNMGVKNNQIASLESANSALEAEVKRLKEAFDFPGEFINQQDKELARLRAENAELNELMNVQISNAGERTQKISQLSVRLSCALEALRESEELWPVVVRYFHADQLKNQEWARIQKKVDAVLTSPDNLRLLERDRLRDSVIQAGLLSMKDMSAMGNLWDALEALDAHEKGGA